ncbi:MAG: SpaA isopeptide-forming pilin-related protein [Mediterraneibacter faecis]
MQNLHCIKTKDCTDPVKVDGKAVTVTSGTDGVAETAQFVRTQTSYWVKETKAPDGYKLAEEPKQVVVPAGGTGTVRFEDERSQYRVKVVKTCTQDKSYLEGAVYGVYSERSCSSLSLLTKVGPTGTGGVAVSDPIDYDPNVTTIYLKELVAPKYHKLSSTVYTLKGILCH